MKTNPFEQEASQYDHWFDTERGAFVFGQELACIQKVVGARAGKWLEVGVGPGRFASRLGIAHGIDISPAMAALSRSRGIDAHCASGSSIPFPDGAFDGVALICTLCFLDSPAATFRECRRVLGEGGALVIGYIPADSPYGVYNAARAKQKHTYYTHARFYTSAEVMEMGAEDGFHFIKQSGCELPPVPMPEAGEIHTPESFVAVLFSKRTQEEES